MNLTELKSKWDDTPEFHKLIHDSFCELVNADEKLKSHRDFIENHVFGFGERSFHWLWKLICDGLPKTPNLLEIGVFRGATLSLWRQLREDAFIEGISPLSSEGGYWESDYEADVKKIHDEFGLQQPVIIREYSNSYAAVSDAKNKEWDLIYIDGDHSYEGALFDINTYSPMTKVGGYLVIDDCNSNFKMPFGYFQGHQSVTDAKLEWLKNNPPFEFIFSVVHISVFQRIK